MKYTKDSRTVTPIPTTTSSKPSSAHHQEEAKRKDDKKPINVDMRDSVEQQDEVKDDNNQKHSASTPRRPAPRGPTIQKQRAPK